MKKISILFSLVFLFLIIFIAVKNKEVYTLKLQNTNNNEQLYINTSYKENYQRAIKLDLNTSRERVLLKKNYDDYPTSTYFEESNDIYYPGKVKNGTQQLLRKNADENKINVLTKDLNYVDFLKLNKKEKTIYIRTLVKKDDRNFHLATFDIKTGDVYIWNDKENDYSVVTFDFSPFQKNLLVVTKSIKEEFNNISNANKNNISPTAPTHTFSIYSESGTFEKEELRLNSFVKTVSLSSDGESFLLNFKDKLEDTSKIGLYSKSKKKIDLLLEDTTDLLNIREPIFNSKNNGFYFIADDTSNTAKAYFFNLEDKTIKEIWSKKNEQPISLYLIK